MFMECNIISGTELVWHIITHTHLVTRAMHGVDMVGTTPHRVYHVARMVLHGSPGRSVTCREHCGTIAYNVIVGALFLTSILLTDQRR